MSDTTPASSSTLDEDQKRNGSPEDRHQLRIKKKKEEESSRSSSPSTASSSPERSDREEEAMMDTMTEEEEPVVKTETSVDATTTSSLEGQLERKEKEISHLEEIVNEKSSTIKELEEKLNRQKDYENIKRELSILKNEIAQIKSSVTASNGGQSFLMEKTKALQTENAALKAELSSSSSTSSGHPHLHGGQRTSHPHPLLTPFLPPSLQNVDAFSSLLGEEIANTYAKVFKAAQAESVAAVIGSGSTGRSSPPVSITNNNPLHVMTGLTASLSPSRPASADDAKSSSSDVSPSPIGLMRHNNNKEEGGHHHGIKSSPTLPSLPKLEPAASPTSAASLEKLQSQLRQNVEKFMNENLNTMNISRCVRELLSVHNIGQRLFAKYVLGLSQGTVSELLSKPKPWDKLTEKGRDSYRKMHAWAADEACIYQLKSLVPRKGKDSTFKQDDPAAEERIQAILSEAQRAMITPRTNGCNPNTPVMSMRSGPLMMNGEAVAAALLKERQSMMSGSSSIGDKDDNSSENGDAGDQRLSPNPSAAVAYANFRRLMLKKDGNTNDTDHPLPASSLPPEVVARIYQEELAKLIGQQVEDSFRSSSSGHHASSNSTPFDRSQDEVRQALAIYQQEISRLSHLASSVNPAAASLSLSSSSNSDAFAKFAAAAGLMNGGYMGLPHGLVDPATIAVLEARAARERDRSHGDMSGNGNNNHRDADARQQHSSAFSLVRPKVEDERGDGRGSTKRFCPSSPNNANSNNFSSSAASEGASGAEDLSAAASPLQRMASITNSLLSQSTAPTTPSTPSRPAKAVLPPITQQQFDQYNNLNTEDIVKHVKEQLSQYSISQRLFGESVLGLSQGSVSDLLARPKPWHMLTQKGREPFIRMKMFLEDDGAVHKLVASQYKIAPEKLMRTTGFVAGPTGPPINSHTANINALKHASRAAAGLESLSGKTCLDSRQTLSPHSFDGGRSTGSTPDISSQSLSNSLSAAFAGLPSPALSGLFRSASSHHHMKSNADASISPSSGHHHHRHKSSSSSRTPSYPQPSVYEMAALTTDLDTQIITTKIKETLLAHNIGQKIFGEVVLGLSQGSVSELLSKPKPWHMLSIKGREPFIRMQLWLSDPNNIDKLQTLKNERREANKRRRTNMDDTRGASSTRDSPLYNFNSNSSGFSPLSSGQSPFPSSGNNTGYMSSNNNNNSGKKPRILFSDEQKEALRLAFSMDSYPTQSTIEFLSSELGLSSKTITNWFHNHRMRLKQVPNSGTSSDPDSSPAVNSLPFVGLNRDGATFDTVQFRVLLAQRLADASARGSRAGNHSDKVSKFHPGIFGSVDPSGLSSRLYANPNSCSSPGSSSSQGADDEYQRGTLDLSMTSSQQLKKISSGSNRSLAGDSDRSRNSFDDDQESDQSPLQLDLHHRSSPALPPPPAQSSSPMKSGSSRRKPQVVMSSSSRRKPAQPQRSWIDTQFSGDEDEDEVMNDNDADDDDLSDSEPVSRPRKEVINGVCVRLPASSDKKSFTPGKRKTSEEWEQDEDDSQSIDGADGIAT